MNCAVIGGYFLSFFLQIKENFKSSVSAFLYYAACIFFLKAILYKIGNTIFRTRCPFFPSVHPKKRATPVFV